MHPSLRRVELYIISSPHGLTLEPLRYAPNRSIIGEIIFLSNFRQDSVGIRYLVGAVDKARHDASHLTGPTIVHCSAGVRSISTFLHFYPLRDREIANRASQVGRSGTFIAIADAIHRVNSHKPVDVLGTVLQMRKERTGMIQTPEQYTFVLRVRELLPAQQRVVLLCFVFFFFLSLVCIPFLASRQAIGDHVATLPPPTLSANGSPRSKKNLHGSSPSVLLPANVSPSTRRTFSLSDLECVVAGGPRRPGH